MTGELFKTVLSGTAVASLAYLLKQFLDHFFFNRWNEYNQVRGKAIETAVFISHFLTNLPTNPKEDVIKIWINASQEARRGAGSLITFTKKRHFFLFGVAKQKDLTREASALLGLARCSREHDGQKARDLARTVIEVFRAGDVSLSQGEQQ
jgi:hypothetical protein